MRFEIWYRGPVDAVMERWFGADFRATPELSAWKNMLERQPDEGYIGCCQAISGTDFYTPTSGLRLPTLRNCRIRGWINTP